MRLQLVILPLLGATALIAGLATSADAEPTGDGARITSDVLVYVDSDNVSVLSPQIGARHPIDEDGGEVSARVVLDAITAASVDVVSNATYRFSELRSEVNLAGSKNVNGFLPSISYRLSHEPDYLSHGFGVGISEDLAGGDTTLTGNYNLSLDRVGRVGTPTSVFSESLQTHSLELGITQVLDSKTLLRAVYTLTAQRGYMEKPYRSVPIFSAAELQLLSELGVPLGLGNFDVHRLPYKPAEEVPDSRYRHAAAIRFLRFIDSMNASFRFDYRLYGDSWGMVANTMEGALAKVLFTHWRLDSWVRFHGQSEVDFWRRTYSVDDAQSIPSLRTTDKSLSPYWQGTVGMRAQFSWGRWQTYAQSSFMYTSFLDHLFIDSRFAIISQGGLRWLF